MKYSISVFNCNPGEVLAEDVLIDGRKFVAKNTMLNSYILNKFLSNCIFEIMVYAKDEALNLNYRKEETYKRIKSNYEISIVDVKCIISQLAAGGTLDYETIKHLSDLIYDLSNQGSDVIRYLNSLKQTDEYTYTHCINVALYALFIGRWMNLSSESINEIVQAGLLHDIGKLKIAENILKKPGKLTSSEFYEIKKHPIYGHDLINNCNNIVINVKEAILMHHERIDGSGYPFGLLYKDIPLCAKIISVADVFDAMTSNRIYKKGTTPFKAFQMFLNEGVELFDTTILLTMVENLSVYYIGMNVMLDSGEIGEIVYISPKHGLSPIIKVNDKFIDFSSEDISRIVNIV